MYVEFRNAARNWNVCRYIHFSNIIIHSVCIGLYLVGMSMMLMLVLSLLSQQLPRAWQLLQLMRTEVCPANECARHRRDTDDVYTHVIHELITSPARPPCGTYALARAEKRTSKRWTAPSPWHGCCIFQRPPCFEGGWESTGRYRNSGLPNILSPRSPRQGF